MQGISLCKHTHTLSKRCLMYLHACMAGGVLRPRGDGYRSLCPYVARSSICCVHTSFHACVYIFLYIYCTQREIYMDCVQTKRNRRLQMRMRHWYTHQDRALKHTHIHTSTYTHAHTPSGSHPLDRVRRPSSLQTLHLPQLFARHDCFCFWDKRRRYSFGKTVPGTPAALHDSP